MQKVNISWKDSLNSLLERAYSLNLNYALHYPPYTYSRMRLIKKVGVGKDKKKCLENALAYENVVDAILLDTVVVSGRGETGGTGKEHDWSISKEIVGRLKKPVILAGGLNPDNAARAIEQVNPFAVDVSSGVEREIRRKDDKKVKRFIEAVKSLKTQ
ncbi:N-(5'-phosphoribosyl)anthranilate isomerase [ANME-1 cluster archaeon GoMg2]|nr:N-(5'-phosphoribosyl)anthranilate isomerase [ANME-1 cluster archaeon GoMg2]